MAFNFVDGAFYLTTTPVIEPPFTISCWFDYSTENQGHMVSLHDFSAVELMNLSMHIDSANVFSAGAWDGSPWDHATVSGLSTNTLYHGCGVYTTTTHRRAIINGDWAGSGVNTNLSSPTGIDRIAIGAQYYFDNRAEYHEGMVAEVAVWNAALTQGEVEALAAGYSPLFIRPASLAFYADMVRDVKDLITGVVLTEDGTSPTVVEHPRIIRPSGQILQFPLAAPVGGGDIVIDIPTGPLW